MLYWYHWLNPLALLEYAMQGLLQLAYTLTASYGLAIILLSLFVNICLLPAYCLAERWQNRQRLLQGRLQVKLDEFSRAFAGATRHAVTRTYYRQQGYHPILALRSSLALLLQLPFFLAAYRLLSHYGDFAGQSFGFLGDLNRSDQLLPLLGERLNLLPVAMTVCNLWAAAIHQPKLQPKEQRQVYLLALLFFVLLYRSPSSLLLYWTCNNIFSLLKNASQILLRRGSRPQIKQGEGEITPAASGRHFYAVAAIGRRALGLEWLSVTVWGLRLLQVLGLLLFCERLIFFKEVDSAIPEAILALYLAAGYILSVHLLQLGLNLWRWWPRLPTPLKSLKTPLPLVSVLLSLLLGLLCISLLIFSWQGFGYFARPMYDRLALIALSLLALLCSLSYEFSTSFAGDSSLAGDAPLAGRCHWPWLRPWSASLVGRQQKSGRELELPLYGNIVCGNLLVFIAVPLAFVSSSPSEFPQIFSDLQSGLLPVFAATTVALFLIFCVLRAVARRYTGVAALYQLLQLLSFSVLFLTFINVFLRPGNYGTLSDFVWDQPELFRITAFQRLLDVLLLLALSALPIVLWQRRQLAPLRLISVTLLVATLLFSGYHYISLSSAKLKIVPQGHRDTGTQGHKIPAGPLAGSAPLSLSLTEHNVVVLLLDRFIGGFVPELLRSYPQLAHSLRDFTWYANTVSLGPTTLVSLPSILGGYDYSIFRINQRLQQKLTPNLAREVNRAYLVLPTILQRHGYRSVILNPQYANFAARGDRRIFAGTGIEAYELGGRYTQHWLRQEGLSLADLGGRNDYMLALLGLFRAVPPSLRPSLYDDAEWLGVNSSASGKYRTLLDDWSALQYLPEQLQAHDEGPPLYLFFNNLISHEPDFMSRDLEPSTNPRRQPIQNLTSSERQRFGSLSGARHFYASGGALKLVGQLLQHLRRLGVYDNSTIVLLSDHSYDIYDPTMAAIYADIAALDFNPGYLHPLLLVKPAGQSGTEMRQDWQSFMSVADLSAILQRQLGFAMHDPFTGKDIGWQRSQQEKSKGLLTSVDTPWNVTNIKVLVDIPQAMRVQDNIFNAANWERLW